MKMMKRMIAALEWALIFPGILFMTALFTRDIQPHQYEPAHSAQMLVDWFAARPFLCLDIFLIALPLAALGIGFATVLRSWRSDAELRQAAMGAVAAVRPHAASLLIAAATLAAGILLCIVALHVIAG